MVVVRSNPPLPLEALACSAAVKGVALPEDAVVPAADGGRRDSTVRDGSGSAAGLPLLPTELACGDTDVEDEVGDTVMPPAAPLMLSRVELSSTNSGG